MFEKILRYLKGSIKMKLKYKSDKYNDEDRKNTIEN